MSVIWLYNPIIGFIFGWSKKPFYYSVITYFLVTLPMLAYTSGWVPVALVIALDPLVGIGVTLFAFALAIGLNYAGYWIGRKLSSGGEEGA